MFKRFFDSKWNDSIEPHGLAATDELPHELAHLLPFHDSELTTDGALAGLVTPTVTRSAKVTRVAVADDIFAPGLVGAARINLTSTARHPLGTETKTVKHEVYVGRLPRPIFGDLWVGADRALAIDNPRMSKLYDGAVDLGMATERLGHPLLRSFWVVPTLDDRAELLEREPGVAAALWALRNMPYASDTRPDLQAELDALLPVDGSVKDVHEVGIQGDLITVVRPLLTPSFHDDCAQLVDQICRRFPV